MNRRHLIASFCLVAWLASSASAQGYADGIVQQLRGQGYDGISVSNTWLGRTRIVANSGQGMREIIIDPRTGEILRDLFTGGGSGPGIFDDTNRSGSGRSGDDDEEEEDEEEDKEKDEEDEEDENNSGHGGGGGEGEND